MNPSDVMSDFPFAAVALQDQGVVRLGDAAGDGLPEPQLQERPHVLGQAVRAPVQSGCAVPGTVVAPW
jgi:hypothetical protein